MKKVISLVLVLLLALSFFGCAKKEEPTTTQTTTTTETTTEPVKVVNPLTGSDDYNKDAVGKRPVALVVENLSPARPQWAIGTSDIIVEGEVEGGISRMLWLYADYTKVPEKVGPMRSARPSYIQFSQLFDSIYIHWGGSHDNNGYKGGYTVIKENKVDHIDGMKGGELFGRDTTRSVSSEHRGVLKGDKLPAVIKEKGFRTNINEAKFSVLEFNDEMTDPGDVTANTVRCAFSSKTDTRKFTYSTEDKKYHTQDWKKDVKFRNLIILKDETKYINVPYKKGHTTYLNYQFTGGVGFWASNGKISRIQWSVKDGKLVLQDKEGNPLKINKGKSYIGLASSNNGGVVSYE